METDVKPHKKEEITEKHTQEIRGAQGQHKPQHPVEHNNMRRPSHRKTQIPDANSRKGNQTEAYPRCVIKHDESTCTGNKPGQ